MDSPEDEIPLAPIKAANQEEERLRSKIDWRLCTIAGLLCSLNLLDSSIISSASVTSMLSDLRLDVDNRFSVSIFIFTIASVCFQLPSTIAVRLIGPRIYFSTVCFLFGLLTLCTAFVTSWEQMIALRVLLGITMSGIYPGLTLLISCWYTRQEQQLRFAFLQTGEVFVLATGGIVNFGLNHLDHVCGLRGWQWMFLIQGLITIISGFLTYFWMVDFPEHSQRSFRFLTKQETERAVNRIQEDRGDVEAVPFKVSIILAQFKDIKIYGFAVMFFLQNIVSTALAYFLPIILQGGMGFNPDQAILLSQPPYYYAAIPALISARIGDRYRIRGPIITFNCICLIVGFAMLGFPSQVAVRYIGVFLATGAYVSNWAALSSFQANNITGQWKRTVTAAIVTAFNGLGGVAGSFIVRQMEAPKYMTAIWVSIG